MFLVVEDTLFDYSGSDRDINKDMRDARKKFGHDVVISIKDV